MLKGYSDTLRITVADSCTNCRKWMFQLNCPGIYATLRLPVSENLVSNSYALVYDEEIG